jgi:hypothetical protein
VEFDEIGTVFSGAVRLPSECKIVKNYFVHLIGIAYVFKLARNERHSEKVTKI